MKVFYFGEDTRSLTHNEYYEVVRTLYTGVVVLDDFGEEIILNRFEYC